jgi:hypothetical protein
MACMRCAPTFEVEHVFVWLFHGEPAPLSPAYQAELANLHAARELQAALGTRAVSAGAVLAGTSPAGRLPLGTHVMLGGTSKYAGLDGWIEKRGRSRYVVRTLAGTITAPFGLVRAVER